MDTVDKLAPYDAALARRLGALYRQHGRTLSLVGGSVRDLILGQATHDLDFTTDATPEQTKLILAEADPTATYSIGEKFGTIGATFDDVVVEITTFRTERYQPGSRKPEVSYGTSLEEDLARRDFTINAMALDLTTNVLIDPFGGQRDLSARLIRAVGKPTERFAEDPLRLLRAVRFVAQLGFDLVADTRAAIRESADLLRQVSRERILEEMSRLLVASHAARGLRLLSDLGLFAVFMPEIDELRSTTQGKRSKDVFEHTLRVIERTPPDLVLRWAALLHDVGKPRTFIETGGEIHFPGHELVGERLSAEILTRLRADADLIARTSRLAGMHMRANQYQSEWTDGAVRRLMRDAGPDLERLLLLSTADVTSYRAAKIEAATNRVRRLRERIQHLEEQTRIEEIRSPLDGNDLMTIFGRGPGPWIKAVKEYLLDQVMEGKLAPDDRVAAEAMARRFVDDGLAA